MRLFADNKSTKLQRKLQQEEQLLFEKEQARKRAQIEQDEKLAKELQAQESRTSRESSTGSASPPPLPARPPKPLAYHPEYLPRVKSDPAVTTPTSHGTMPFSRIRTTSTPTVIDKNTFPPRSPARASPTGPQPNSSGRSSPPLYPPTISPSPPPTRPTSTQVYQSISTVPPKPPASAPPSYPRRDPVMFIVPAPHANTTPALPPAPRPEPMPLPSSNNQYSSSPTQNSYPNEAYHDYQDFTPSQQQEYYHYQPLQMNQPQHHQQNNSTSSYTPAYPNQQQEWKHSQNTVQKAQPPQNEWAHQATPQPKPMLSQFKSGKPDDVGGKQLVEVKRRPSKIQTVTTHLGDSDSDSDDYSDFVIRVGPTAHRKMVEEKSSFEPVRSEKSQDDEASSPSKIQEASPIDLVDPFADTNAIEKDSHSPDLNTMEGGSSYFTSKAVHPTDQGESSATKDTRPSLSVAADIQRPESAANFRQMQARLNALLNGNPGGNSDQSKTIHESPEESIKIENEDEVAEPDEKVEMAHEVTVASVNTPAQLHSHLHNRSKSTPPEQFPPMTRTPQPYTQTPQPYTRTTQPPKLLRPPIPKTPKPIPNRSKSVPESPTTPTDARRNTIAEPPLYPPTITPSLPPAMLQGDVLAGIPHNEFGFYRVDTPVAGSQVFERKALPQTPPNLPKEKSENRHITCKLPKHFTAGHRVWIAIKPSDTGKTLAHRIHVVATLRTMKITGIKTAAGRDVPLDNTPVFPTWQDIETFHDGELWTFETGSEPENFLIQGGKDWFKQIITNMRD